MNRSNATTVAYAVALILAAAAALADVKAPVPVDPAANGLPQHAQPAKPSLPKAPDPEELARAAAEASAQNGADLSRSMNPAAGTTLQPPVSITYTGTANALQVTAAGTGRAVQAAITDGSSSAVAVFGSTNGTGPGVVGYNTGKSGLGGKFAISYKNNPSAAMFATTAGTGPAVLGTVTAADSEYPAIYGTNTGGIGVEGTGNEYGVYGTTTDGVGVEGIGTGGYGVVGESTSNIGVYAYSSSNNAIYAYASQSGNGLYSYSATGDSIEALTGSGAEGVYVNNYGNGRGITVHSAGGIGLYASSDSSYGIWGQGANTYGVIGEDSGSGIGVYGKSGTGYAGYFAGPVAATSYATISDRNAKTNIRSIDRQQILDRVNKLPITSWDFKGDLTKRHVGPMAQDFHAQFGLNGEDDTHINLTDMAGVSLAAIQELSSQMKVKDAQIAELKKELSAQAKVVADLTSMAARFETRMTVLERGQGPAAQTVAMRTPAGAEPGAAK